MYNDYSIIINQELYIYRIVGIVIKNCKRIYKQIFTHNLYLYNSNICNIHEKKICIRIYISEK